MKIRPTSEGQKFLAMAAAAKIKCPPFPEPNTSIGFLNEEDALVGGVTFTNFTGREIWASIWCDDPRMWTRTNLFTMFDYCFGTCNVRRISVIVKADNSKSLSMVRKLGFVQEGVSRDFFADGLDGILFGMLKEECKWIKRNGKKGQSSATSVAA
jgi:RimJ/RimL family protein N-acetyltransferase